MKNQNLLLALLFSATASASLLAQPPGGAFGGPFGGPGMGGPGMGGPGMGGPGMGGPGMGGPWGGPGGGGGGGRGGRGGGEGRGGEGGGMGGGMGGFDPSQFLSRMDTNGNGSIDPEEAQGPARFMLDRLARDNPKIDLTKPIPLSTLTDAFQKMRGGPGGPGGGGPTDEELLEPENNSLVPGFSVKRDKSPVPGFGASGERAIKVDERDLKEADDRIKRYDKNNDGALDENEMKEGRWTDSPMQYDRNRDGKLSRQELATRQSRRRTLKSEQEPKKKEVAAAGKGRENSEEKKETKPNVFEKIASYRLTDAEGKPPKTAGLPEWFTKNDINNDNQVSMKEISKKWNAEAIEDFQRFDTNQDGFITSKECLVAVKKVIIPSAMLSGGSSSSSVSVATKTESPAAETGTPKPMDAGGTTKPKAITNSPPVEDKMRQFAASRVKKLDKDKNGFLSPDEFKEGDFAKLDLNQDGKIDVEEYAAFRNSR